MSKTILITGAGSGFGEGAALELVPRGHKVIAGIHTAAQKTALLREAERVGLFSHSRFILMIEGF